MTRPSFTPQDGSVWWDTFRLSDQSCEELLDIFEREDARAAFNDLYEAHLAVGGIARVSSMRRVAA